MSLCHPYGAGKLSIFVDTSSKLFLYIYCLSFKVLSVHATTEVAQFIVFLSQKM